MTDAKSVSFPVLPLRDIVVFPNMIVPLFVGREKSVRALEAVMENSKEIILASQIDPSEDDPTTETIYQNGVLATVMQLLKLPDGTVKVLVEGQDRVQITEYLDNEDFFEASADILEVTRNDEAAIEALTRTVSKEFERYAKMNKNVPDEALATALESDNAGALADTVAGHLAIRVDQKQELLETLDIGERLEEISGLMQGEMSVLKVERKIKSRVKNQMARTQREYYLNEQMKAIQKELGDGEGGEDETSELEELVRNTKFSKEAKEKARSNKLNVSSFQIIYELIEYVYDFATGKLKPKFEENYLGRAEILKVFKVSKIGSIAGCIVSDGGVDKKAKAKVIRNNETIYSGDISSLMREKNEANEVKAGTECGIGILDYQDYKEGDIIEIFNVSEVSQTL